MSNIFHRISTWILVATAVLLPVFFLPYTQIPVEVSKGLIFVVGLATALIFYLIARFVDGRLTFPKSYLPLCLLGVILIVFLSALFSSSRGMSFFGTIFDVGSFWFIFAGFIIFLLSAALFDSPRNARLLLYGILFASAALIIFQYVRIFLPGITFSVLRGQTDNLLGSWNTLGLWSGFIALLAVYLTEFSPLRREFKWGLWGLIVLALGIVFIVNLKLAWILLGIFSLLLFIHKFSLSRIPGETRVGFPITSLLTLIISILLWSSSSILFNLLPDSWRLSAQEVRPAVSTTAYVAKEGYARDPVLGLGPNRFSDAWAMYKPEKINLSVFWNTNFDSGVGTLPTFIATTGVVGLLGWLAFFVFFVYSGIRAFLRNLGENGMLPTIFFLLALYLLLAAFFYPAGTVVYVLFMVSAGAFLGTATSSAGQKEIAFLSDPRKSFFVILVLVLLISGTAVASFKYLERFASLHYFTKTLVAKEVPAAESAIQRAVGLHPNDLFWRTYSQVYLLKLGTFATKSSLSVPEQEELQNALNETLKGGFSAVAYNPDNFLNHQSLGVIYLTLGSYGIPGAYEKAIEVNLRASELNPLNPALKLLLSRSYVASGDIAKARELAEEALLLKGDYLEAREYLNTLQSSESAAKEE